MCLSCDKATVPTDRRAPKWWLGRDDGDPILLAHCAIKKWMPSRCQNQKRLYSRTQSDLVGFFS